MEAIKQPHTLTTLNLGTLFSVHWYTGDSKGPLKKYIYLVIIDGNINNRPFTNLLKLKNIMVCLEYKFVYCAVIYKYLYGNKV